MFTWKIQVEEHTQRGAIAMVSDIAQSLKGWLPRCGALNLPTLICCIAKRGTCPNVLHAFMLIASPCDATS